MSRQAFNLEKFLNTNASSANFVTSLDSYLYNVRGITTAPDKIKFIIRTTDIEGNGIAYTLNGQTLVGLVMLINPASVSLNLSKMINRTQTMTGWVEEHWGEELDTITLQGSGAGFIWEGPQAVMPVAPIERDGRLYNTPTTQSAEQLRSVFNRYMAIPDLGTWSPVGPGDNSGLAVSRRRETVAYEEFKHITQFMNANAATFDLKGFVKERLYIQLSYDYACYRGYFESIDITESADTPFKFIYTITYKSERTVYSFLR
jgi:hypothetical protein